MPTGKFTALQGKINSRIGGNVPKLILYQIAALLGCRIGDLFR